MNFASALALNWTGFEPHIPHLRDLFGFSYPPSGLAPSRSALMKSIINEYRRKCGKTTRLARDVQCDVCGSVTFGVAATQTVRVLDQSCQQCFNTHGRKFAEEHRSKSGNFPIRQKNQENAETSRFPENRYCDSRAASSTARYRSSSISRMSYSEGLTP